MALCQLVLCICGDDNTMLCSCGAKLCELFGAMLLKISISVHRRRGRLEARDVRGKSPEVPLPYLLCQLDDNSLHTISKT